MTQDEKVELLLKLAKERFKKLSPAEETLFRAAAIGMALKCSDDVPEEDDPAKSSQWPAKRRLRADCIIWLCTDSEASKLVTQRGIHVQGARIDEKLDLLFARIPFPLYFSKCSFSQEIDLRQAKIAGLNLEGSHTGPILADALKIDGSVFLRNGFKAKGEVLLLGATIGGDFDCREGRFLNKDGDALSADNASIKGNVFLDEGFRAKGQVRLPGASIGGELNCTKGRFLNKDNRALNADGVEVKRNVYLREGFRAEGKVSFAVAQVYGAFVWTDVDSPELATLDIQSAKIGTLWDDQKSWPKKGKLVLHGLIYDQLADQAPTDAKSRIDWLRRQGDKKFRPQPYEQLAEVLRKSGHDSDAKKILIQKNKERRRLTHLGFFETIRHVLLGCLVGFGYRPWRPLWYMLAIILLGCLVFGIAHNLITPPSESAYVQKYETKGRRQIPVGKELSSVHPKFNFVMYSIDSFVPLVDLHQTKNWLPNANRGPELFSLWSLPVRTGGLIRLYLWFHILSGWVLTTLFVVGLTGVIRR